MNSLKILALNEEYSDLSSHSLFDFWYIIQHRQFTLCVYNLHVLLVWCLTSASTYSLHHLLFGFNGPVVLHGEGILTVN